MISGVVICQNEESRIQTCIEQLNWVSEIVIVDGVSDDNTIGKIKEIREGNKIPGWTVPIRLFRAPFGGHFGDQKNLAISKVRNPWTFVLDADETIEPQLSEELTNIATSGQYDAVKIPRKNYLDGVMTEVYPDFQVRFFRSFCRYIYAQHEELVGSRTMYEAKNHILHYKSVDKYNTQQDYYKRNQSLNRHFMRLYGEQK